MTDAVRAALAGLELLFKREGEDASDAFERVAEVFRRETGYLRPGKDCRLHDIDVRRAAWDAWYASKLSDTKPLDDPRLQQLFGDAIEGALAFGYQGENPAPPGHWLERFWHLGRAEAEKTLAATPPPMPARLNDQRIVELMRPLADDALIRPHVIAAARAAIAEHERLNGISATPRQPLSEARIEEGRHETFSTNNPFCPCDSKTMLKAVRWAERAHGITPAQGNGGEGAGAESTTGQWA